MICTGAPRPGTRGATAAVQAEHLAAAGDDGAAAAYVRAAVENQHAYRLDRALAYAERALDTARQPEDLCDSLATLGDVQLAAGRTSDAIASFRRSIELANSNAANARAWLGWPHRSGSSIATMRPWRHLHARSLKWTRPMPGALRSCGPCAATCIFRAANSTCALPRMSARWSLPGERNPSKTWREHWVDWATRIIREADCVRRVSISGNASI